MYGNHPGTERLNNIRRHTLELMIWNESNIILAVVGMVDWFTAIIWQRSNRITLNTMANVEPKNDDWYIRNAIYCWLHYFDEDHQWHSKYSELAK